MTKKELIKIGEQISDIEDHLEIVYTAFCIQCAKQQDSNNDITRFSEELQKKGWRVSEEGNMLCPDCAKAHEIP